MKSLFGLLRLGRKSQPAELEAVSAGSAEPPALDPFYQPRGSNVAAEHLAEQIGIRREASVILGALFRPQTYCEAANLPLDMPAQSAFDHFIQFGLDSDATFSPFFDPTYYSGLCRPHNGLSAIRHWLTIGINQELVPTPAFNSDFYHANNPDVAGNGRFAFAHYILHGRFEGRAANAWFDPDWYQLHAPTTFDEPALQHYLCAGVVQGISPNPLLAHQVPPGPLTRQIIEEFEWFVSSTATIVQCWTTTQRQIASALYNHEFYGLKQPAIALRSPVVGFAHFLIEGLPKDTTPSPLFDPKFYRAAVEKESAIPDGVSAFEHWIVYGIEKRITPTARYSEAFYRSFYNDMAGNPIFVYEHYARYGIHENRRPNALFDPNWYAQQREASKRGGSLPHYVHFLTYGIDEGLAPTRALAALLFETKTRLTDASYDALLNALTDGPLALSAEQQELAIAMFFPPSDGDWENNPLTALESFLRRGLVGTATSTPFFNANQYRIKCAKVGIAIPAGTAPIVHFLQHGIAAGLLTTHLYDEATYLRWNRDIAAAGINGFKHFLIHGIFEGRQSCASPSMSIALSAKEKTPPTILHWLTFWRRHGYIGLDQLAHPGVLKFLRSPEYSAIVDHAQAIDPEIGDIDTYDQVLAAPIHDRVGLNQRELISRFAHKNYDTIVCVPWIRMGGADLVAGLVSHGIIECRQSERLLVLRIDQPHFERSEWLPKNAEVVDISDIIMSSSEAEAEYLLYMLFLGLAPKRIINVNSRFAWQCYQRFGERLAPSVALYGYFFCWDRTPNGVRAGYPSMFFPSTAHFMKGIWTDTDYLRNELITMYNLPASVRDRIVPLYSPSQAPIAKVSCAMRNVKRGRSGVRPRVLWAGRLDRQKRFDLLIATARALPDVDFDCWGAAVLDASPNTDDLPKNIRMHGPFRSYDDLPFDDFDVWLFTSAWEGMPTILIELAARGVPVVASAVGGVPELINSETGWPVQDADSISAYIAAVRDAIDSPAKRVERAARLQQHVAQRYNFETYVAALNRALNSEGTP